MALIKSGVEIDVIYAVFAENSLTASVFALDRDHCAANLITRKIGNFPCHMGKIGEEIRHSAALVVDDEKRHIGGAEIKSEREYTFGESHFFPNP